MEWSEILQLRIWSPLSEIAETEPVEGLDNLFRLGPDAYVQTRESNPWGDPDDSAGPFLLMAYWANSPDAVKREVQRDAAVGGRKRDPGTPPQELLGGTSGTYGELNVHGRTSGHWGGEAASYSDEGPFLYKEMCIGRFKYFFLDRGERKNERVSLIEVRLMSDDRPWPI